MKTSQFAARLLSTGLIAACFSLPAGTAMAEGWLVRDFGPVADPERCMSDAVAAFEKYVSEHGGQPVHAEWIAAGYDLASGDDAIIICPFASDADTLRAFLIVHGQSTESRTTVADRLEQFWEGPK
jgi:hypothetical protein